MEQAQLLDHRNRKSVGKRQTLAALRKKIAGSGNLLPEKDANNLKSGKILPLFSEINNRLDEF